MKKGIGVASLALGSIILIINLKNNYLDSTHDIGNGLKASIFYISIGIILLINAKKDKEKKAKQESERKIRTQENEKRKNEDIIAKNKKADKLSEHIKELKTIDVLTVDDYRGIIIENEKNIIEKGGENQLFLFLKIDSFLKDYRSQIIKDKDSINQLIDIDSLKNKIIDDSKRSDIEKINENVQANLAKLEGRNPMGFDSSLENIFKIGGLLKPSLENQIKTLEFYNNISIAMIAFYLNDKKIRYFEIYEAFEKLGVFDSTWQKNVLNKLENIEIRLAQINNQLTDLNQNFITLVESSENIVSELKEINSSIITGNMLQLITAYQTWKINKNTKSLLN